MMNNQLAAKTMMTIALAAWGVSAIAQSPEPPPPGAESETGRHRDRPRFHRDASPEDREEMEAFRASKKKLRNTLRERIDALENPTEEEIEAVRTQFKAEFSDEIIEYFMAGLEMRRTFKREHGRRPGRGGRGHHELKEQLRGEFQEERRQMRERMADASKEERQQLKEEFKEKRKQRLQELREERAADGELDFDETDE